jgi:MFS family permease
MSIRSFIIGMIGIFIPIYLYTLTHQIRTVILLYLLMFSFEAFFELPSALFMARFGPKHNIALSLPILVFHFWLLWTLPEYNWPIWFISLTAGICLALFWEGYNYDFSRSKNRQSATVQVSRMYIIIAILGAIAPFIGGTIASKFGLHFLFGLATGALLFAVVPLFMNKEVHLRRKFNVFKLRRKRLSLQAVSYCASGIEATTNANFWPLFVFLIVGNYQKVGLVTSTALLLTIIVTYIVGKTADERGKCGYIKLGSSITGLAYFAKAFVDNIFQVFGLNIITAISHSLFTSPFVTEYYLHADEDYRSEYIFLMEFAIDLGRVLFLGILYFISFYLPTEKLLMVSLLLGGLITFGIGLMPDSRCEIPHITNKKIKVSPILRSKS